MTVANLLFSVMTIAARLASRSAPWTLVGGSRALVGALVALSFALKAGTPLRTKHRGMSWARSLLGTLSMLTTFYALSASALAVGDAVTIFSMAPIFIAIFSPRLLGERPSKGLWGVLLVAFAGVALVAGPKLTFLGSGLGSRTGASLPALAALLAAIFSALAMMFLRKMRSGDEPDSAEAIALHFALVGTVAHACFALFTFRMPTLRDMGWLLVTGLTGGLAQLAMTRAYALTEAARLGAVSYLGTITTFVASIVFLGERPVLTQIAGSLLVVGAGVALAVSAANKASPGLAQTR